MFSHRKHNFTYKHIKQFTNAGLVIFKKLRLFYKQYPRKKNEKA